jgi:hypothetical protein
MTVAVGDRVILIASIYDDGEDHHPPGWIAYAGEEVIVKEVRGTALAVAHEGNKGAFMVYPGEYQVLPAKPIAPKGRLRCDICGDVTETGHTNLMCRLVNWIDR